MHDYSMFMDRSCDSAQFGYENSIDIETGEVKFEIDKRRISCSLDSLDLRIAEMEARKHNQFKKLPRQTSKEKLKQKSDEIKRNFHKICDDFSFMLRRIGRNYRFLSG